MPSAQVQVGRHRRHRRHVDVLRLRKQREAHGAVFGVVAGDQLGFALRQIKRQPIGFRKRRLQKNGKGDWRIANQPFVLRLVFDDLAQVQVSRQEEQRDDAHAHRDLVRNHLRAGADAAEERVLGVCRVTRQHNAIHAQ